MSNGKATPGMNSEPMMRFAKGATTDGLRVTAMMTATDTMTLEDVRRTMHAATSLIQTEIKSTD